MVKLTIFFRKPTDVDAFEEHFSFRHVPLIGAMPKVVRSSVSRAIGAPRGEAPYHLIHDIYFEDMAALNFALNSAEGRAAGADLAQFARDTASLMFSEVWGEDPFEMGLLNADSGSEPVPPEPADVAAANAVAAVASSAASAGTSKQVPIDVSFLERPASTAVATDVAPEAVAEAVAETPANAPSTLADAADAAQAVAAQAVAAQAVAETATPGVTPSDTPAPDPVDSPNPQSPSSAETPA